MAEENDFIELTDNDAEAVSGGATMTDERKEAVIRAIESSGVFRWMSEEQTSLIIAAIRTQGFGAAKAIARRFTQGKPELKGLVDLIPNQ